MQVQLSSRLETVASYIPVGSILADIGSDHAYLPVYALQKGLITRAIAVEVVEGPFESARQTVRQYVLSDQIDVRLGDGLSVVHSEDGVTAVSICGMGGELISQILDRGHRKGNISGNEVLILQPNVAEHLVRRWLNAHHYDISKEVVVEDHHRLYEIIVAYPTAEPQRLTELQLTYGPRLMENPTSLTLQKWQRQLEKIDAVRQQLQCSSQPQETKIKEFTQKYNDLKGVIEHANR